MTAQGGRPAGDAGGGKGGSAVRGVSVIMVLVMGLSFLFGFGNSWALGVQLGVPAYVAPLVAPAVDLSVIGLLLGIRQLALGGASTQQMRPAWRLLVFAGFVTLALNVAQPLIERNYGKAAFDAVGPLLLIGWAEVGPGLLHAMQPVGSAGVPPVPELADAAGAEADDGPGRPVAARPRGAAKGSRRVDRKAREQDLLHRARAEDVLHWQEHQRPISAETLRKRLHVGAPTARRLVALLRSDIHTRIDPASGAAGGDPQEAV